MGAGEEDAYDDDRFLKSPGEQDLADEGQGGRSSSTNSRYTRDSFGNPKLRGNEMMQWMDRNPDPQPMHREPRLINPAAALGIPDVTRASFQSGNSRDSGISEAGGEQRRSDRVMGQYRRTFGERMKATGGGIGGFFKALFGRGMRRANLARYGA
jgi:hypothetical protein